MVNLKESTPNQAPNLTGVAMRVSRDMKVLQAAPLPSWVVRRQGSRMADWEMTIHRLIEVTMTKRRWLALAVAGVLGVVVCMALLVLALKPTGPGVTKANFDRIKAGMSRAEVEERFGRPADTSSLHGGLKIRHTVEGWHGVEGNGSITSDEARGVVADKEWSPRDESILQRVRRLLRLS